MKKALLVGGTWDLKGGKPSGLISKMYDELSKDKDFDIGFYNGGNYTELDSLVQLSKNYNIVYWMANVPNDLPKARYIKTVNPHVLLIGSKRNHYDEYSFVDVYTKSLEQRNNLTIEFIKKSSNDKFRMLLFDPLGGYWYDGYDINELVNVLQDRIKFIMSTTRVNTYNKGNKTDVPDNEEFISMVKKYSEVFLEKTNHSEGVITFMGNASFRKNGNIYMSERDINKSQINKDRFVEVLLDNGVTYYYGEAKPSKDAAIQTRLYNLLPNINYMVHSHCYIENAPFTSMQVPCGALEEVDEVIDVIRKYYNNDYTGELFVINLIGHGSIMMSNNLEQLKNIKFIGREIPENMYQKKLIKK